MINSTRSIPDELSSLRRQMRRDRDRDMRLRSSESLAGDLESLRFQRASYQERIEQAPQDVSYPEETLSYLEFRIGEIEDILAERERLIKRDRSLEQYRVRPDHQRSRVSHDARDLKRLWPIRDFCERVMYVDLDGGRNPKGMCPLPDHDDRSPSFTVYPESGSWHCYGCNRGGDIFTLTALYFNLDPIHEFPEVLRHVAEAASHLLGDGVDSENGSSRSQPSRGSGIRNNPSSRRGVQVLGGEVVTG